MLCKSYFKWGKGHYFKLHLEGLFFTYYCSLCLWVPLNSAIKEKAQRDYKHKDQGKYRKSRRWNPGIQQGGGCWDAAWWLVVLQTIYPVLFRALSTSLQSRIPFMPLVHRMMVPGTDSLLLAFKLPQSTPSLPFLPTHPALPPPRPHPQIYLLKFPYLEQCILIISISWSPLPCLFLSLPFSNRVPQWWQSGSDPASPALDPWTTQTHKAFKRVTWADVLFLTLLESHFF